MLRLSIGFQTFQNLTAAMRLGVETRYNKSHSDFIRVTILFDNWP